MTTASKIAIAVMDTHIAALNAGDEALLATTLHFPHFRLSEGALKTWATPDEYFADFRKRAGSNWHRSAFEGYEVVQSSATKVHLKVQVVRYDADETVITRFPSLWVITQENNRWAAKFRSSFAAQ